MLIDTVTEESKLQRVYTYQNNIIVVASDSFEDMVHKLQILFSTLTY